MMISFEFCKGGPLKAKREAKRGQNNLTPFPARLLSEE
jgi:hypothetical protein